MIFGLDVETHPCFFLKKAPQRMSSGALGGTVSEDALCATCSLETARKGGGWAAEVA